MLHILSMLAFVVLFLSGIISIIALIKYKRFDQSLKIIAIYFTISFIAEVVSLYLARNKINNLFIFHIFSILEFVILFLFFKQLIFEKKAPILNCALLAAGVIFLIIDSLFIQGIDKFNSFGLAFVSSCVLILSILFFKMLLDKGEMGLIFEKHKWIIMGIFISHAVSLVVLLFSNAISGFEKTNQYIVWILRAVIIGISKLIICYALLQDFTKIDRKILSS